jgi:hypothetical protein
VGLAFRGGWCTEAPLWAASREKDWSHPLGSLASDAHDASWSPAACRTEYKVVGSSGGPRTRDLRLGTADPPNWPVIRAQPSKRDTGVGGPQGRGAPPSAVALRAILDLHPPPCPATFMVGTQGWSLRSNRGIGSIGKPRWKTLDIKSPIQGGLAATMPPRRSRAASVISGSIPPAFCLVSSSTPLIFRTPTAPGIC